MVEVGSRPTYDLEELRHEAEAVSDGVEKGFDVNGRLDLILS